MPNTSLKRCCKANPFGIKHRDKWETCEAELINNDDPYLSKWLALSLRRLRTYLQSTKHCHETNELRRHLVVVGVPGYKYFVSRCIGLYRPYTSWINTDTRPTTSLLPPPPPSDLEVWNAQFHSKCAWACGPPKSPFRGQMKVSLLDSGYRDRSWCFVVDVWSLDRVNVSSFRAYVLPLSSGRKCLRLEEEWRPVPVRWRFRRPLKSLFCLNALVHCPSTVRVPAPIALSWVCWATPCVYTRTLTQYSF
jgi:hypothetical protein